MPDRRTLRIVVAEDAALLREGLVGILERAGHEVVASVEDADALLAYVAREQPDLVVTDIRMPPGHSDEGLRAAAQVRAEHPGIAIMVLSAYVADAYVADLLDSTPGGGIGYLLKDRVMDAAHFMDAVGRVAGGGTALDPAVIAKLLGAPARAADNPLGTLTERERSVLELMAEGLSNTAIAARLFLSEGTISKHTTTIFAKLGLAEDEDTNRRVRAVLAYLGAEADR